MFSRLLSLADELLAGKKPAAVGISCGGPLNSETGVVLGPPNLPGWTEVPVCRLAREHFRVPAALRNDADAGALAEWRWGAGKGCRHMVFLTFGTGLGAGLILNGQLYSGACDMGGEAGHIRLAEYGPAGYGKSGSFEGFCSGSGIAQLAETVARETRQRNLPVGYPAGADAREVAEAARRGDPAALQVFDICAEKLGQGLSVLIDILNPEKIVIGSLFGRCRDLLYEKMAAEIRREALPASAARCEVVPAGLGENVGDYAALAVAMEALNKDESAS